MTIAFSNFSLKMSKIKYFWSQLCNKTNSKALISNKTIVFSNFYSKIPKIRCFWSQNWGFLCLHGTLQLDKFQGADFKYENSFFKLLPKTQAVLVPVLEFLIRIETLYFEKCEVALNVTTAFFSNFSLTIPK